MSKTMLIDATHPEETRVAVVDGRKLEEFDVEIAGRRPLKGNIYLAKVTRVEPSLQACFVEYGGNRHGFLAFSEIHPDYYRIPVADREALIRETRAAIDDHEPDHAEETHRHRNDESVEHEQPDSAIESRPEGDEDSAAASEPIFHASDAPSDEPEHPHESAMPLAAHQDVLRQDLPQEDGFAAPAAEGAENGGGESRAGEHGGFDPDLPAAPQGELIEVPVAHEAPDTLGRSEPASQDDPEVDEENARRRRQRALRRYKIQEVIKRRQILLVQVTKEERGNKGAALTTYLSLAGRYCVLMPNTDRGGGISRRITSLNDRKRLKNIVDDLDVPEGMAVIVRTAGSERSKAEVKRDFEYLLRLWDEIRETTLNSTAPALIYEEASLIKRSIRDLYTREMGDIIVAGVDGYTQAKSFMRMLTPSHAKRVQLYRDATNPLFQRYQVESQLAAIHNPVVHLRSGGYIVINQTEALVAIDVNSGRATKERNIEETALKTNAEAAEEITRQLRLRDLAGLIVIDFIDMEESRNNSTVERRLKDSLRNDRARIQVGRISSFGLLEMSRQRLHPSLQEASTEICPHCRGSGRIRSVDSTALHVLRMVEEEITKSASPGVTVFAPTAVALYILNQKRAALSQLEMRRGVRIYITGDDTLTPPDFRLDRIKQLAPGEELPPAPPAASLPLDVELEVDEDLADEIAEEEAETAEVDTATETEGVAATAEDEAGARRRRKRRRRGRGNRFNADEFTESADAVREPASAPEPARETAAQPSEVAASEDEAEASADSGETEAESATGEGDPSRRRRRRGRRGGRRRSRRGQEAGGASNGFEPGTDLPDEPGDGEQPPMPEDSEALPPQWRQPAAPAAEPGAASYVEHAASEAWVPAEFPPSPARARPSEIAPEAVSAPESKAAPVSKPVTVIEVGAPEDAEEGQNGSDDTDGGQPRRRGWWRRLME